MPTPLTQRPPVPSPRYGPTIPPLRPQPPFPQPPPYNQPTSTDNYRVLTPHLEDVHKPQNTKPTQFVPHQYRLHSRLPVTQRALHEAHSPHLLAGDRTLLHQHTESHTGQGPNSHFQDFINPLGIKTIQGIHVPERIN